VNNRGALWRDSGSIEERDGIRPPHHSIAIGLLAPIQAKTGAGAHSSLGEIHACLISVTQESGSSLKRTGSAGLSAENP
jgi:hypothetical protein